MPLPKLVPGQGPAPFDVQDTAFTYDVLGRYVCNTWEEIQASQDNGGYPFDAVVLGAGMFGGYIAEKLYRLGTELGLRILIIEAGALLFATHIQNLPQRIGGKIGGPDYLRQRDDASGTQNVIWGMPWISNEGFPGLAYCIGARSLFWGGWAPRLTDADLNNWPPDVRDFFKGTGGNPGAFDATELEIGAVPTADFMLDNPLHDPLKAAFEAEVTGAITAVEEAPLAVVGAPPATGVFAFDKFSSAPFLIDAIRDDVRVNASHADVSRRVFLLPRTQVLRLNRTGGSVTSIDLKVNGVDRRLTIEPTCAVVFANGTIESTRLALDSLGVGSTPFGSPRVGNLMAHLRSNIVVRIRRDVFLASPPTDLETVALLVRGEALGRRFHLQLTAASVAGADSEKNMWNTVPDIELLESMIANQDPDWVSVTLRGIGEMEDQQSLNPNPNRSWIDLSNETDGWGMRRAYVNLVATNQDFALWTAMDNAAFDLALRVAQDPANIQYWNKTTNQWQDNRPQPDANGRGFWQDPLGTTHHEAGTLFMGAAGSSVTNTEGRFHTVPNAFVAGPALFPTLGSANPSLTGLALARRTAAAVVRAASPSADPTFTPLSLDPKDWRMVRLPNTPSANVRHYGRILETFDAYGLYWYMKEQFTNFILRAEWRVGRRDDNSGIYIRIPAPTVANPLQQADSQGHEIQIDERGFDSQTNTEGHPQKRTGAIYDLQAPSAFPSKRVGVWNTFDIKADGTSIEVTLNGQVINSYTSNRRPSGFIALQAHHFTSRVQFRNPQIKELP